MCLLCTYRTLLSCKLHQTNAGRSKGKECACKGAAYLLKKTGYLCGDMGTILIIQNLWAYKRQGLRNVNGGEYASKFALIASDERQRNPHVNTEYEA